MDLSLSKHIISLFLFLIVFIQFQYLYKVSKDPFGTVHIRSISYFVVVFSSLTLTILFIPFLGAENGLLCISLGMGIVTSFIHPVVASTFFVSLTLLRPWEQGFESPLWTFLPKALAFVCILSWSLNFIKRKEIQFSWNSTCNLYVSLLFWFVLSATINGPIGERMGFLFDRFFPVTVILLVVYNVIRTEADLSLLRSAIILSGVGLMLSSIVFTFTNYGIFTGARLEAPGLYGNSNDLASIVSIAFPLLIAPFLVRNVDRVKPNKFYAFLGIIILLMALWLSQSRGALISVVVAFAFYYLACTKLTTKQIIALSSFLLLSYIFFSTIQRSEGDLDMSKESRQIYAIAAFRMAKTHPILGVGIDNYQDLWSGYVSDSPEFGKRTAHSSWMLAMAESGFVGFGFFAALFINVFLISWKIRKVYPEYLLSLIAYGISMSFLSHTYLFLPYMVDVIAITAARVFKRIRFEEFFF